MRRFSVLLFAFTILVAGCHSVGKLRVQSEQSAYAGVKIILVEDKTDPVFEMGNKGSSEVASMFETAFRAKGYDVCRTRDGCAYDAVATLNLTSYRVTYRAGPFNYGPETVIYWNFTVTDKDGKVLHNFPVRDKSGSYSLARRASQLVQQAVARIPSMLQARVQ